MAAFDEGDARRDAVPAGNVRGQAAIVGHAGIERVVLDQQPVGRGCVAGERSDDVFDDVLWSGVLGPTGTGWSGDRDAMPPEG